MDVLFFILILAALIIVHEGGHFFAAKLFGIRVDEFAIGFPPRLASVKHGETEYSVNLLLFGGFVRIFGEKIGEDGAHEPRSFANKSRWIQAGVVVAGIAMNLVFAWLLLSSAYLIGMPTEVDPNTPASMAGVQDIRLEILNVLPNAPAAKAGLKAGDIVDMIQTGTAQIATTTLHAADASSFIGSHSSESLLLTVLRGGKEQTFLARAEAGVLPDDPTRPALGIEFGDVGTQWLSFLPAFIAGGKLAAQDTALTSEGLWNFFSSIALGRANFAEVSGPVGIAQAGASAIAAGWSQLLFFAALISISLALINVLPIPGLDGGRLLIIAIEGIRRKPVSECVVSLMTMIGFSLLALLMIIVTYHDIARLL